MDGMIHLTTAIFSECLTDHNSCEVKQSLFRYLLNILGITIILE